MLSLSQSMLAQYIGHPADSIEVAATLKDTLPQGPEGLYTPTRSSARQQQTNTIFFNKM